MKRSKAIKLYNLIFSLGMLLAIIFRLTDMAGMMYLTIIAMLIGVSICIHHLKCPCCGAHTGMGRFGGWARCCPECGTKLDDE